MPVDSCEELQRELQQLILRLRERDRTIFDLEEQIRGRDAIIVDKCLLIERLEQSSPNCGRTQSPDAESLEENSQSTVQHVDATIDDEQLSNIVDFPTNEQRLCDELEWERNARQKAIEQNEFLIQQWDEALNYVEQVQKRLQMELKRSSCLLDENALLRKRVDETMTLSRSGIQFVALLFVLLSLYLYALS